jgi:hypothetical protein
MVRELLEEGLGVTMNRGFGDLQAGTVRNDTGFVWADGFARQDPAILQSAVIRARVYLQWIEPRSPENPIDPSALEDLAEVMRDLLAPRRSWGGYLLQLVGVDIDYEFQGAEAVINAVSENPYETVPLAETV